MSKDMAPLSATAGRTIRRKTINPHPMNSKPAAQRKTSAKTSTKTTSEPRLSRQRKPLAMAADDWQRALRRQFGSEQAFELKNLGDAEIGRAHV